MSQALRIDPWDDHNRRLVAQVHPAPWQNPAPQGRYNLVVVGAGTAGLVSAVVAAGLGARVALVERHLMGGDCLNVGCVPSKTLIRAARAAFDVGDARRFGVRAADPPIDFARVMERVREVRADISPHDSAQRFSEQLGVDVYLGHGRFTGPDRLVVDASELRFRRAVIATGARAAAPPIPGLEQAGYLTNETLFNLTESPGRLAVIGAGPIGCEMAQSFARLGVSVTLLEMAGQVLPREDPDAAAVVSDQLVADGVELIPSASVAGVERHGDARVIRYARGDVEHEVEVDQVLVAIGRAPNVEELGLEEAGIAWDRGGVQVDDKLRTTNKRVFAAGDVCMTHKFTHAADAAAKIVVQNALFWRGLRASSLLIPWCTYTDPEVAHVGLSESQAREAGTEIDTYTVPLSDNDRSRAEGESAGFVKIHTLRGKDRIAGATIVARHAGEMISEISVAMAGGVGLAKLSGIIHPYPTQAEAIKATSGAYMRSRLTPGVARLFRGWLRLTR